MQATSYCDVLGLDTRGAANSPFSVPLTSPFLSAILGETVSAERQRKDNLWCVLRRKQKNHYM